MAENLVIPVDGTLIVRQDRADELKFEFRELIFPLSMESFDVIVEEGGTCHGHTRSMLVARPSDRQALKEALRRVLENLGP